MNKQIITIIVGIFLISFISATNLTAGDSYSFELSEQYSYYEITKNITEIDLNVTQNQTWVIITPNKYMKDGNFTITFYNQKDEPIYSSGGGSSRRSGGGCITTWVCNDWTECIDEEQTRICEKIKSYCYAKDKPIEYKECEIQIDEADKGGKEPTILELKKKPIWIYILCTAIVLTIIFIFYKVNRKKQKSKTEKQKTKSL